MGEKQSSSSSSAKLEKFTSQISCENQSDGRK